MRKKAHILVFLGLLACSDEDNTLNTPPVASYNFEDGIDRIALNASASSDAENDKLSYHWSTTDNEILINPTFQGLAYFKIPKGAAEKDVDVKLTVSDGKSQAVQTQRVRVPAYSTIRSYGLGKALEYEVSNNVNYEWYGDQSNTGDHSLVNCGPTSVTMAIRWFNENFKGTPRDARDTYRSGGGWWYTDDIINYLNKYTVSNHTITLDDISRLKTEIDDGNIAILCLDMYMVQPFTDAEYHFNKFYATQGSGWGHFIVIKGYKQIDGHILYEAYDPYSFGESYAIGGLKGKDRYYSAEDLNSATTVWWDYAIVIQKSGAIGGRKGVDVNKIIHMPGR